MQEVVYTKAKLGKRLISHFFDISILALSVAIFFSITNMIVTASGFYRQKENDLVTFRDNTGLYVNNIDLVTYIDSDETLDNYEKKKNELSQRIDNFYQNSTYVDVEVVKQEYNVRKLANPSIFEEVDGQVVEKGNNYEAIYAFYCGEYSNTTLGYLFRNVTYFNLVRYQFWASIVQIAALITLFFAIYYLVFPLTLFKRGRQTIGMKLEKIALISVRADNIQTGVYVGRFFFMYFVFIILNFVSFGIPSIVSISMTYFSKTNSSLPNYVFNDYMVDVTSQKIYLNALEMEESAIKLQEISIENNDLRLK